MTYVNSELYELWSLTEDWIDEIKKKTWRSACRIGTTIEMKNDKKRVEESRILIEELQELSDLFFVESGELEEAIKRNQERELTVE